MVRGSSSLERLSERQCENTFPLNINHHPPHVRETPSPTAFILKYFAPISNLFSTYVTRWEQIWRTRWLHKRLRYSLCTDFRTKNGASFCSGLVLFWFECCIKWWRLRLHEFPTVIIPVCVPFAWGSRMSLVLSECSAVFPMCRTEGCIFKVTDL